MSPAFPQPAVTERHKDARCQHQGIPLRPGSGLVYESAYTRILIVDEVTAGNNVSGCNKRLWKEGELHQVLLDIV